MLKTGITTLEEARRPGAQNGFLGGTRKISITLYPEACAQPDGEAVAERILFQFADGRGAYKRTYTQRFLDFDKATARIIRDTVPGDVLNIHDAAVSDGRTALDFFSALVPLFSDLSYTASDFNPSLSVVRCGKMTLTFGDNQELLEICRPPFVFNNAAESALFYPVNKVARFVIGKMADRCANAFRNGILNEDTFLLFAPRVLKLAQDDSRFALTRHDILKPFTARYHVIRMMNVLNLSYFSPEEFRRIARHVHDALHEGGLFIMGSNEDAGSPVNGGVYRRTPQGFEEIWRSAAGPSAREYFTGLC